MIFSDRMRSLLGVGTVAAVTIAAIGDFFAPKGGWMFTMLAGLIGLLLLLYALLCAPGKNKLGRLTGDTPENPAWWGGLRWKQHGVHVLAVFTGVCLLVGSRSFAYASSGGILGSHIPMVSDAQQMTGLMQQSIEEQRKTRQQITTLTSVVKKETSSNPREQLANLGVAWTMDNMEGAIRNSDAQTLGLFFDGGMKLGADQSAFFNLALTNADPDVLRVMLAHREDIAPGVCQPDGYFLEQLATGKADLDAYAKLCNNPATQAAFKTAIDKELADQAALKRANEAVATNRDQCVQKLHQEYPPSDLGKLADYPSDALNGTIDTPEKWLQVIMYQHFVVPQVPGESDDDQAFYAKAVVSACDRSYSVQAFDDTHLQQLEKISRRL